MWPDLALKKVTVPEGKRGNVVIKRFRVTPEGAERYNFHSELDRISGKLMDDRSTAPGWYTGLWMGNGRHPMMSDTPAEMRDHAGFVRAARGDILVAGLGIGLVVENLISKANVRSITVIERDADVIALAAPHYLARRMPVSVVHENAFLFRTRQQFDFCWLDIWPDISDLNLLDMVKLRRYYRRFCLNIFCWAEIQCLAMARARRAVGLETVDV